MELQQAIFCLIGVSIVTGFISWFYLFLIDVFKKFW